MKKLKLIWYYIKHPKEIGVISRFIENREKIKDYDRLAYDYGCVLCHATHGIMSKTNYDLDTMYSMIDQQQEEVFKAYYKSDLLDEINRGATIEDIKEFIKEY